MRRRDFVVSAAAFLAAGHSAKAHTGPQLALATPSAPSKLSHARLAALPSYLGAEVEAGRIPGAVVLVQRRGETELFEAVGYRDRATGAPMEKDTVFRIFSMTKPIVSVAAMMLVEEGRLNLDDPVDLHIPELKNLSVGIERTGAGGKRELARVPATRTITVTDLLRHTSGLTYGYVGGSLVKQGYVDARILEARNGRDFIAKLAKLPLSAEPGTAWDYGHSTDVLGVLIERVTGRPLDEFLERRILRPLGMKDTRFFVPESEQARLAAPLAPMRFNDVSARPDFVAGGHGLYGTAADYLRFATMLLNGGELDGVRYLSKQTVDAMTADHCGPMAAKHAPGPGYGFGLGVAVRTGNADVPGSPGDYYWSGWAGTFFWIDPRERLIGIMMLQAPERGYECWVRMRTAVYGALRS